MSIKEKIQEDQYEFPYHYLTDTDPHSFGLSKYLQWGLAHASYLNFISKEVMKLNPHTILDAGCGEGRIIFELEKKLPTSIFTGVDISERALHFARGFTSRSKFYVHDLLKGPISEKSELCVSIEVIEHIEPSEIEKYVNSIAESLVDGGHLIITTPTTNLPLKSKHYQHFTKELLTGYLDNRFEIVEIKFLNIENSSSIRLARLLANKFFIINNQKIKNFIFDYYSKHYFEATESTGARIYIRAKKR